MTQKLDILLLEDCEEDAILIERALKHGGHLPSIKRVWTFPSFHEALLKQKYDVILADYNLQGFSGMDALKYYQSTENDTPFIVVSGTIGEDVAVEMMRNGANDYILKDNLSRLLPAIERELRDHAIRKERAKALNALQTSQRRYRDLVENISEGTVVVRHSEILYANPKFCEITGRTLPELLTRSFSDLLDVKDCDLYSDFCHDQSQIGTGPASVDLLLLPNSKHEKWCHFNIVPIDWDDQPACLNFVTDITQQRKNQEDLLIKNYALDSSLNGIVLTDLNYKLTHVNESALAMWGYDSSDQVIGKNTVEFWNNPVEVKEKLANLISRGYSRGTLEAKRADGSTFIVQCFVNVVKNSDNEPICIIGSFTDMTDNIALEKQLRQAIKMEAVGRLAGGVAHDFNNLLTVITGYTEIILEDIPKHDPLAQDLSEIHAAALRAADLTRQLLAFSRQQSLDPKVINLNYIIDEMSKMLRRTIGEDIDLAIHKAAELWRIEVDPGQIEQVIINLAVNARDAMPSGGKLEIETQNVVISENNAPLESEVIPGTYMLLSFRDTGEGMTDEVKSQIFEPFYTTKSEGKGTGLGLSTVYGIVKQSGGHIEVKSELGVGTEFNLFFPMVEDEVGVFTRNRVQFEAPKGTESILLVEDEAGVRRLTGRILRGQGYTVLEAQNGGEAYLICQKRPDEPVDLIISDVVMPHMSGYELVDNLQNIWGKTKVLYMSGYNSEMLDRSPGRQGDRPMLKKPFHPIEFARKVREILDED